MAPKKRGNKRQSQRSAPATPTAAQPPRWHVAVILTTIVVLILAAYAPSLRGVPIWDDEGHITKPELRSLHGLYRIWFEPGASQQYYPLLHSAFWVEYHLWGEWFAGYRLVNIVLHSVSVILLYLILRRLKIPGALLAAAIFALHPVMVE